MPKGIKRRDTLISLVLLKNLCNAPGKSISRSPPMLFSISNKSHDSQYNQPILVIDQIRFKSKGRDIRINISIILKRDCLSIRMSRSECAFEKGWWWSIFVQYAFSIKVPHLVHSPTLTGCKPTVCVTRGWAGQENTILTEPTPSHANGLKTRRVPPVGCTLC